MCRPSARELPPGVDLPGGIDRHVGDVGLGDGKAGIDDRQHRRARDSLFGEAERLVVHARVHIVSADVLPRRIAGHVVREDVPVVVVQAIGIDVVLVDAHVILAISAALAANAAMVLLYWDIGQIILGRQGAEGWGAKVIDRLAFDLREAFPDMHGFSSRNLKYMRAFAVAWPNQQIVQRVVARLPWGQNLTLLERLDDPATRIWYAEQVIAHGWSRAILAMNIQRQLHKRAGRAVNNFKATLPPPDSDLAAQVFKDPYLFDFLGTADPRRERDVEDSLVAHIERFLLEMGAGFAFVGRQVLASTPGGEYVASARRTG